MPEQKLSDEQKNRIIEVLNELEAVQPCPRCGNDSFGLLDDIFNQPLRLRPIGSHNGPQVPSIAVVCDRCGFMSQHALFILEERINEQKSELEKK
jgi:ribosomal protein S27AE